MNSSLYTGVLGLQAHQTKMNVIANNISNVSTYGFKKGRATFSDILSATYKGATAPGGNKGGTNPMQVGYGVTTTSIQNIMTQGPTETTGRALDVAIDGSGWFVLEDGSGSQVYTRNGNFGLDKKGNLVNTNGWYVQGWSNVSVTNDHDFKIDTTVPVDSINFAIGDKLAAQATSLLTLACNLNEDSRSLIADGIDPKEGFATANDKLVDLYNNDEVNPESLGLREGDWIEIHVSITEPSSDKQVTVGQTANVGTGSLVYSGAGVDVYRYSGYIDSTKLPAIDPTLTAPAGVTLDADPSTSSPNNLTAGQWTFDSTSGMMYIAVPTGDTPDNTVVNYSIQHYESSTLPMESDKYLYFQITNDTTIGDLQTSIQNALNAMDSQTGTLNAEVEFDADEGTFIIRNNDTSGSGDLNNLSVDINAVSGSGIRQGYLLRESSYPTLVGTRLGITNGGLAGVMGREVIGTVDYQTMNAALDYGSVVGNAQIYAQVERTRLEQTYSAGFGGVLDVNTAGDWEGYTGASNDLKMVGGTEQLSVNGTIWSHVNAFTGAANEYVISTGANGAPAVIFNTADGLQPASGAEVVFTYRTDDPPNVLLSAGTDYEIDTSSGLITLKWNDSSANASFGNKGFTGTLRVTADYTTEDRSLTPPGEIMNSRWADFAQELADVTEGGSGHARTSFNTMFAAINDTVISDQATSSTPTEKETTRFQSAETYRTSVDVYDSLGDAHTVELVFTHVGSNYDLVNQDRYQNRWYWRAELSYDDALAFDSMDSVLNSSAVANNHGTITFNESGLIQTDLLGANNGPIVFDSSPIGANGASTHATAQTKIELNFDGLGNAEDGVTQYASEFTTRVKEQNGWEMGILDSFAIDSNGIIQGTYSNNVVKPIAQIALAMFANEEALQKVGGNNFIATANTGTAHIVAADVAGSGTMIGSTLESSNVDIVTEFTEMIATERGFQANSRIITTSDEMLTEVINLKR